MLRIPGFEAISWNYAGMQLAELASWIVIATLIGYAARRMVGGAPLWGLWGDMVLAIAGGFLMGNVLRFLGVDLTAVLMREPLGLSTRIALVIDVALASLVGAALLRLPLRLFKR